MKKALKRAVAGLVTGYLLGMVLIGMAGCTTTTASTPTQSAQLTMAQGCAAWTAALSAAVQLRAAGKLTPGEISQITLLDSQVNPICSGPIPADATAATQQVTTAVTTLTILELAKSEAK